MGARVYIPELGRFLQVDSIEGGVDNNYVYPTDQVNKFDLNGMAQHGKNSKQPKQLSASEKKALSEGKTKANAKMFEMAKQKMKANEKLLGERGLRHFKGGTMRGFGPFIFIAPVFRDYFLGTLTRMVKA